MPQITLTLDFNQESISKLQKLLDVTQLKETESVLEIEPVDATSAEPIKDIVSESDIKAVCLEMARAKKTDAISVVFSKFGAKKLTEIETAKYPELLKELIAANA